MHIRAFEWFSGKAIAGWVSGTWTTTPEGSLRQAARNRDVLPPTQPW
jgi:hypothetical protein